MASSSSPLLVKNEQKIEGESQNKRFSRSVIEDFRLEMKMIWLIACPAILTSLFQYSIGSVTLTLSGRIGTLELAAVGVQNLVISGIGYGVMLGMGSALETLCGQAFGAQKLDILGIYMQRSWVILLFTASILSLLYIFAEPILKLLGQEDEIATLAGKFSIWMIPQLYALALNFPIQKFLQAQSKMMAMTWISFITLVFHVILSWICIVILNMGLLGSAFTLNFSWWILVVGQLVYILSGACKDAWTGFSLLAFTNLMDFIWLSLSSAIMLCLEYWCMMVVILLAGLLNNPEIAVDTASICMNVEGWCFMIPLGFTAAISVRVSNELGAGRPKAAKFSVTVMVAMSILVQTFFIILILTTRKDFPALFTRDKIVMEKVSKISLFLAFSFALCSIQPVLSGVAIGAGWQSLVAYVNIGCYYLVGMTSSAILGFKFNLGLEGIWGGILAGIFLQTVLLIIITWRTDWEKEAESAKNRIMASMEPLSA